MMVLLATVIHLLGPLADLAYQTGTTGITGPVRELAAGLAIGLGGIGPGIGIGIAAAGALQAIGRNPDAAGDIRNTMILGAGLSEAVAIYAFVIALVLLFVSPN